VVVAVLIAMAVVVAVADLLNSIIIRLRQGALLVYQSAEEEQVILALIRTEIPEPKVVLARLVIYPQKVAAAELATEIILQSKTAGLVAAGVTMAAMFLVADDAGMTVTIIIKVIPVAVPVPATQL
jgi:hypothetical protein